MKQSKMSLYVFGIFALVLNFSTVFAAGFEKSVMWSGKWAGVAGAASGAVSGSDSLFYNPAGLVLGSEHEVSLNYSPLFTKTAGAQTKTDEDLESDNKIKNVFGVTSKMNLTHDLALGLGVYVSGGVGSTFKGVDYSSVNSKYADLHPDVESDVSLVEVGLGGAYRLNSHLAAGLTWRTSLAQGKFSDAGVSLTSSGNALIATKFSDLKAQNYKGLRAGLQYLGDDKKWGIGASYRSSIDLKLDGSASGKAEFAANGAELTMTGGKSVSLTTIFPQQINMGGFFQYSDRGTFFTEYSWTDYSKNKDIKISGDALRLGATNVLAGKTIVLKWKDAHALKIGNEYMFGDWALRAGYALTSQVTNEKNVSITFTAPGIGHSFTLGTGTSFLNKSLLVDLAGEFSRATGDGTLSNKSINGDYSSQAFGIHSSLRYLF